MSNFKEIVTKAIIGKAKKSSTNEFNLTPELTPDTILGCWVINNHFNGTNNNGVVLVNGSFDVNVWYSYDNDSKTAVSNKTFTYSERMPVHLKDNANLTDKEEIIVRSLKQPTVSNVKVNNGVVSLTVEKEMGVEIVGDTKIKVSIEEDEDEYEEILEDEVMSEKDETQINEVNEDYLN